MRIAGGSISVDRVAFAWGDDASNVIDLDPDEGIYAVQSLIDADAPGADIVLESMINGVLYYAVLSGNCAECWWCLEDMPPHAEHFL